MTKIFTGIGSRETPENILNLMRRASKALVLQDWTLRSGGADGADFAFACGWGDALEVDSYIPPAEIFIPWNGFNGLFRNTENCILQEDKEILKEADKILKKVHPAFDKLTKGPLALHRRNIFQVLGARLDVPTKIVVAYSKLDQNGEPTGGTATAIRLAQKRNIPVRNLYLEEDCVKLEEYLKGRE